MMKFLSWFFMILGILIIINGLTVSTGSAIHQIYAQSLNLTGFIIFFSGLILPKICIIADNFKPKENKEKVIENIKKEDKIPTAELLMKGVKGDEKINN